jgi:signal transduction histidine kinase
MEADTRPGRLHRLARPFRTIRARTAIAATLVVGVALVGAGFVVIELLDRTLSEKAVDAAEARAAETIAALSAGQEPDVSLHASDDGVLVQVLDGEGVVIAAGPELRAPALPMGALPGPGETVTFRRSALSLEDERFHVRGETVTTPDGVRTVFVAASLDDADESTRALTALMLAAIPLLLVAVAGVTWVFAGRALAPVEAIRREVAGIKRGDLGRRVPVPSVEDEIGRLAATMNQMLGRLQQASDQQERFVADAAHELRSPLAILRAKIEVAQAHEQPPGWENGLHEEVLRTQKLVDDLLLLAQEKAGATPANGGIVDFDDLVLAAVQAVRAVTPGVTIDAGRVSAAAVRGDGEQLGRLARNLLENAARYARTRVEVSLAEAGGRVTLAVSDDGPGIAEADHERVFERFTRLDASRSRGGGGAGLGLAICRTIVEAHGGSITIDSAETGGARLVVTLPGASGG